MLSRRRSFAIFRHNVALEQFRLGKAFCADHAYKSDGVHFNEYNRLIRISRCYRDLNKMIVRRKSGNEAVKQGEALHKSLDECDGGSALALQQLCGGICKRELAS